VGRSNVSRVWRNFTESSDLDPEVYLIVTKKYATLKELDEKYSVNDIYDLLEIIDLESDLEKAQYKDQERINKMNKQ